MLTEEQIIELQLMALANEEMERQERQDTEEFILAMEDFQKSSAPRACGGGIVQTKTDAILERVQDLPTLERQGFDDALQMLQEWPEEQRAEGLKIVEKLAKTRTRTQKKARFDRHKRTIVGARVNRDFAELCKAAADASGKSLNKWCYQALRSAMMQQMRGRPRVCDDVWEGDRPYLL